MRLPRGKVLWTLVGSLTEAEEGAEFGIAVVVGPLLRV